MGGAVDPPVGDAGGIAHPPAGDGSTVEAQTSQIARIIANCAGVFPTWDVEKYKKIEGSDSVTAFKRWLSSAEAWKEKALAVTPATFEAVTFGDFFKTAGLARVWAGVYNQWLHLNEVDAGPHASLLDAEDPVAAVLKLKYDDAIIAAKRLVNYDNDSSGGQRPKSLDASMALFEGIRMRKTNEMCLTDVMKFVQQFEQLCKDNNLQHGNIPPQELWSTFADRLEPPQLSKVVHSRLKSGTLEPGEESWQEEDACVWANDEKRKFKELKQLTKWTMCYARKAVQVVTSVVNVGLRWQWGARAEVAESDAGSKRPHDGEENGRAEKRARLEKKKHQVEQQLCKYYAARKSCRYGQNCKFKHESGPGDARPGGNGGGAGRERGREREKAKSRLHRSQCWCCGHRHALKDGKGADQKHYGIDHKTGAVTCPWMRAPGWKDGISEKNLKPINVKGVKPLSVEEQKAVNKINVGWLQKKASPATVGAVMVPAVKGMILDDGRTVGLDVQASDVADEKEPTAALQLL